MKKFALVALLVGCAASSAFALPPIPGYIVKALKDKPDTAAYAESVEKSEAKCASCHYPGKDKKAKGHALNDFGKAMHKHLDDKAFMAADKAKENEKATELFLSAWEKASAEKNAEGKTFGELIKDGKMPGNNNP